jgi:hypothetical protein
MPITKVKINCDADHNVHEMECDKLDSLMQSRNPDTSILAEIVENLRSVGCAGKEAK